MPRLKVNNSVFYREPAISQEEISYPDGLRKGDWKQEDFIKDIEQDLIDNPAAEYIPKYQTHAQIYERMKGRKHWDDLLHKIGFVCHFDIISGFVDLSMLKSNTIEYL